jgi:hypothetical protein
VSSGARTPRVLAGGICAPSPSADASPLMRHPGVSGESYTVTPDPYLI